MQIIHKQIGETPLEAIEKFRFNNPDLKKEKLSYIGRLDPMAEGQMIVLIGKEENQNRQNYLNLDKEYLAEFLIGFETDTGDLLGLLKNSDLSVVDNLSEKIQKIPNLFSEIKKQKYPWFSSKHVLGKALFEWFKSGQFDEIERPIREITIYNVEIVTTKEITIMDLENQIKNKISLITGNFRQKEILEKWHTVLVKEDAKNKLFILSLKIKCSTGTYIRALTENLSLFLKRPTVLFSLERTKIFLND